MIRPRRDPFLTPSLSLSLLDAESVLVGKGGESEKERRFDGGAQAKRRTVGSDELKSTHQIFGQGPLCHESTSE